MRLIVKLKGGPGSGFTSEAGHCGIPGQEGGSRHCQGIPYEPDITDAAQHIDSYISNELEYDPDGVYGGIPHKMAVQVVEDNLQRVADESALTIRRHLSGSIGILESGRIKTQFETNTSGGVLSHEIRIEAEYNGLGVPEDIDAKLRPVYGCLAHPRIDSSSNGHYGEIEWVLNDDVKQRTSMVVGDSLYPFGNSEAVGSPMTKPSYLCIDSNFRQTFTGTFDSGVGYIEAQIHGGVSLKDVVRVNIHVNVYNRQDYGFLAAALDAKGIPYQFIGRAERHDYKYMYGKDIPEWDQE